MSLILLVRVHSYKHTARLHFCIVLLWEWETVVKKVFYNSKDKQISRTKQHAPACESLFIMMSTLPWLCNKTRIISFCKRHNRCHQEDIKQTRALLTASNNKSKCSINMQIVRCCPELVPSRWVHGGYNLVVGNSV